MWRQLRGFATSALKLNVYVVTHGRTRGVQCGTAHANAEAAASNEHRAAGERHAVERAGHPHLTAPAQLGNEVKGDVDHGEATRLVLTPAADSPAEQRHDSPPRAGGRHRHAASRRPMPSLLQL